MYPVTDSGLKVKGAHTLSLFPSGENVKWGQSKSYDDEGPMYYNREKLDSDTNQLKECLLCKNTIASGFNQLKYIPFLYLKVELPLVRSFSDRNIYLKEMLRPLKGKVNSQFIMLF